MTATYHLTIDELKPEFIDRLKQMFSAGQVTIVVEDHDETAYLLGNPANRELLMKSIEQDRQSELIPVDRADLLNEVRGFLPSRLLPLTN